jgi:glycosyltransferase involved in cell wall biosynthesis
MADRVLIAMALDYPLTLRGGVSVIVESLLEHLSSSYRVLLISPDASEALGNHPCSRRIDGHICFDPAGLTPAVARDLVETIRQRGVRLVHFHAGGNLGWGNRSGWKSPLPGLARAGIPSVFSAHQVTPLLENYCANDRPLWYKLGLFPVVWSACTYALRHASQILTDSRHDADQLKRGYPLLAGKIDFVYHSRLDAARVVAPAATGRETTILSVGHIAFRKGQHILAEAFARIAPQYPEWKLVIAGPALESDCAQTIERISAAPGLRGRILMIGSHPAPQELMQTAAIFVQPSLMEALGLALQEAMFFGCACIGSNVGGIPELIAHQRTGLLCPAGDIDALAGALGELMRQPDQRLLLARAAQASILARGMTGQAMAANHEKVYQRILKNHE